MESPGRVLERSSALPCGTDPVSRPRDSTPYAVTPTPSARNPDVAQADTVRVVVVEGSDALTWYNDYKSKVSPQAVSGYGDQAYYDGYASLNVLKGDSYVRIAVSPAGAAPSLSAEEQLATAILPKL